MAFSHSSSPSPPPSRSFSPVTREVNEHSAPEEVCQPSNLTSRSATPASPASVSPASPADDMAPRSSQRGGGRASFVRREADLSIFLTPAHKNELLLLATTITDAMQQQIWQVFDQPVVIPMANVHINTGGNSKPRATETASKPGIGTSINASQRGAPRLSDGAAQRRPSQNKDKAPATKYQEENGEDDGGVQSELKKEALAAFRRWQAALTKRVSEIAPAKDVPIVPTQQNVKATGGRPIGRGGGRVVSNAGKASRSGGRGAPMRKFILVPSSTVTITSKAEANADKIMTAASIGELSTAQSNIAFTAETAIQTLTKFSLEKRQLLLHIMLLLLLSLEGYPTYSRDFMMRLASHMRVPTRTVAEDEARVAKSLSLAANFMLPEIIQQRKSDEPRRDRRARAASSNAGGPLAALAAPVKAARIGGLGCGLSLSQPATSSVLGPIGTVADGGLATCVFFGLCGSRGSPAKTLDTYTKDIQDILLIPLHCEQTIETIEGKDMPPECRRLRLSIGISGWLLKEGDAVNPWRVLGDKSEAYALGWERETLTKMGASLDTVATSMAWQSAKEEFATRNVIASLEAFKWPGSLLKISKIVDNPWSVGMVRADKVGIALADAIVNKVHGDRGVSLLGYGLGARVIYTCLMSLSERRAFGFIESVIMMGTPAPSAATVWTALRSVVSSRVINVYAENDSMLGFLHRTSCIQFGVAGLQRVQGVYGIENVDATELVSSHLRYSYLVGRILKDVGWEDLDTQEVAKSEEFLSLAEKTFGQEINSNSDKPADKVGSGRGGRKRNNKKKLEARVQSLKIA